VRTMSDVQRILVMFLGAAGFAGGLAASGCLQTSELVCTAGTTQCNVTCVDLRNDPANCGVCGVPCQPRAVCSSGVCTCGGLSLCNGACSSTTTDPNNCGGCATDGGTVCSTGQVCAPTTLADGGLTGTCQVLCSDTICAGACVDVTTDPGNCGGCAGDGGTICAQGYGCHPIAGGPLVGGCEPDVVASCIASAGSVAPMSNGTQPVSGPAVAVGSVPGALGVLGGGLLVADEGILRELALPNLGAGVSPETVPLGSGPNFVEVTGGLDAGSFVYVVNSTSNTLSILAGPPLAAARVLLPDGGLQGLGLRVDGGYGFGQNTFPQPFARLGNEIFVPLYGGYTAATALAGGKVVRLDVSNPSAPVLVGIYDLNGLNLQTFDGGQAFPRPSQAILRGGFIYVVLNNLDSSYAPAGPPLLAKIDPVQPLDAGAGSVAGLVVLDASRCLDAQWMAATSTGGLLVSCFGQATFDSNFNTVAVDRSGVLSLDVNDVLISSWSPECPATGPACIPPIAGRVAVAGSRAFVGDQSSGRVFVLSISGYLLQPVADYTPQGGVPLQPCPVPVDGGPGQANVSDLVTVR
jgi:LVIVD repeat